MFTGTQAPVETKTTAVNQILDSLSLQKRMLWLHGVATSTDTTPSSGGSNLRSTADSGTADSRNLHTMSITTSALLDGNADQADQKQRCRDNPVDVTSDKDNLVG